MAFKGTTFLGRFVKAALQKWRKEKITMEDAEGLLTNKPLDALDGMAEENGTSYNGCRYKCCPLIPLASCIAALGGILFGYDIGIISGAILQLRQEFNLTCTKQEVIVTSLLVGGLIASIVGGYLVDALGRRIAIILNSLVFITGAVVLAASGSYTVLVIGRILLGFAVSLSAIGECIYISEIAPPKRRGLLVSLNELGITFGILLAYLINFIFIEQANGWRWMFGLSVIFGIFQAVGMFLLPASPRWLLSKGRIMQAEGVIAALWPDMDPKAEVERLRQSMHLEKHYHVLDLFRKSGNMRFRMLIGCGLVFFQQVTGQPTVLYYAPAVFQSLGFNSGSSATLATVGLGTVKVGFTILALALVDRIGRRGFLLFGAVSMTSSLIVLSVITQPLQFKEHKSTCGKLAISGHHTLSSTLMDSPTNMSCHQQLNASSYLNYRGTDCENLVEALHVNRSVVENVPRPTNHTYHSSRGKPLFKFTKGSKYVCLLALMVFVAGYALGYGPMSWLVLTEIFPVEVKGRAVAIATIFNWGTNILISSTFLGVVDGIGLSWTFTMYAAVGSIAVIFVYHFVPETKRKSLEQLSAVLDARSIVCPDTLCCCNRRRVIMTEDLNYSERRRMIQEDTV